MNARTLVKDEIYERLRERINSGAFPPGTFLPSENGLIEHFKVSRTPVRAR